MAKTSDARATSRAKSRTRDAHHSPRRAEDNDRVTRGVGTREAKIEARMGLAPKRALTNSARAKLARELKKTTEAAEAAAALRTEKARKVSDAAAAAAMKKKPAALKKTPAAPAAAPDGVRKGVKSSTDKVVSKLELTKAQRIKLQIWADYFDDFAELINVENSRDFKGFGAVVGDVRKAVRNLEQILKDDGDKADEAKDTTERAPSLSPRSKRLRVKRSRVVRDSDDEE